MDYQASSSRYDDMIYRRCGRSGLKLPLISLGLWHNFGEQATLDNQKALLRTAFDLGITHFDLANNYGPPGGAAESSFGRIFAQDFRPYRDELIISTKAGYGMWSGPYGDFGSRKYLVASLDQSLSRMGLDYVDIFYHHRPDPETPLEETMTALDHLVRQGKALYIGLSNYHPADTQRAAAILRRLGTPCLIHQPSYSLLNRWVDREGLLDVLEDEGIGCIAYSGLAQGLLSGKYLHGLPADSRAVKDPRFLKPGDITPEKLAVVEQLNNLAVKRGQSLSQMALAWLLRHGRVTSALIGASRPEQLSENAGALLNLDFSEDELRQIDQIAAV
ncbi:MAG: L-glyceraldehyde 3-phosphate reductase [Clostridiaceae bacterium]|nr:L-glyceraldehyde 3-phosphate reductase [Clostridiaceae bacterium]